MSEFLVQVAEVALSILHSMVAAHSDIDDAGEIVTPTPRVKRILSSPRCLPHIAQVILLCLSLFWFFEFGTFVYLKKYLCHNNIECRLCFLVNQP